MLDDQTLGGILLSNGLISDAKLASLKRMAAQRGQSLYRLAIEMKAVSEEPTVSAIAKVMSIRSVSLRNFQRDPQLLEIIPEAYAKERKVLPIGLVSQGSHRQLYLAMIDPLDLETIEQIRTRTGIEVVPVLAGPVDMDRALERLFGQTATTPTSQLVPAELIDDDDDFGDLLGGLQSQDASSLFGALDMLDDHSGVVDDDATPKSGLFGLDGTTALPAAQKAPPSRLPQGLNANDTGGFKASEEDVLSGRLAALPPSELVRATVRALVRNGHVSEADIEEALES